MHSTTEACCLDEADAMKENKCDTCYRQKKVCLVKRRKNHLYIVGVSVTLQRYPSSGKPRATAAMARCLWSSGKRPQCAVVAPKNKTTRSLDETVCKTGEWAEAKKKASGIHETSHTFILTSIKSLSRLVVSHVQHMPVIAKRLLLLCHHHGHWKGRRKYK